MRLLIRHRSQEDERDARGRRVGAQPLRDLPAVEIRHRDVEHGDVRPLHARTFDRFGAVRSLDHGHPLELEVHAAEEPNGPLVVCDENANGHRW